MVVTRRSLIAVGLVAFCWCMEVASSETATTSLSVTIPTSRPEVCGKVIRKIVSDKQYVLQSPERDSTECRWRLIAAKGMHLKLTFVKFDVDSMLGNLTLVMTSGAGRIIKWKKAPEIMTLNGIKDGHVQMLEYSQAGIVFTSNSKNPKFTLVYEAVSGKKIVRTVMPNTTSAGDTAQELPIPIPSRRPRKCGKGLRKIVFGKPQFLLSPSQELDECRWRLQTTDEFNIKLTFVEFAVDSQAANFSIIQLAGSKSDWSRFKVLLQESDISAGMMAYISRSVVGVEYTPVSSETKFAILYEAVLPPGGCNYEILSSSRSKEIRTPGFPRKPYKGAFNCTWTLRSNTKRKQVEITITKLQLTSKDALLIHDGPNLVMTFDSSQDETWTYTSSNEFITIHFLGEAHDFPKGFVIKYISADAPTKPITTTTPLMPGKLRCFKKLKAVVNGMITPINNSSIEICDSDSVCLFVKVASTSSNKGLEEDISIETTYGSCFPKSHQASYGCEEIWNDIASSSDLLAGVDIEFSKCGMEYCETGLCNYEKDIVMNTGKPVTSLSVTEPRGDLSCYSIKKSVITSTGMVAVDSKTTIGCEVGSVCFLAKTKTITSVAGNNIQVAATYGSCVRKEMCSEIKCEELPTLVEQVGVNLTYTSCKYSCCDSDLCNDDMHDDMQDER